MSENKFPFSSSEYEQAGDFLQNSFIDQCNTVLHLSADIIQAFYEMLEVIRKSAVLTDQALSYHQQLFHMENAAGQKEIVQEIMEFVAKSPEELAMFIPVVLVSALPQLCRYYQERAIPVSILSESLFDLELNLRRDKGICGYWGTDKLEWLIKHFTANIYQLGRLQFHFNPFEYNIKVYRHLITAEIAVLAGDQVAYRKDGCVDGTNGIYDLDWVANLEVSQDIIRGHRITSDGLVQRGKTELTAMEWEQVLTENDAVVMIHIPDGSKLTSDLCYDSYKRAIAFFEQYFAEIKYNALICATWLLAPQWRELLPTESNIILFQGNFQLFPILGDEIQTYERVFGNKVVDYAAAPQATHLQRVLLEHLKAGGRVNAGAGFMLKHDLLELEAGSDLSNL